MRWIDDPCDDFTVMRVARDRVIEPYPPLIADIQRAVASAFEVDRGEMTSDSRARVVARPRQVAMYLAKRLTRRSMPEIGRRFGGRDHTTVMHAVKTIERLRKVDAEIDGRVRSLIRQFEGAAAWQ